MGGSIIIHGPHELGWHLLYNLAHGAEQWAAALLGGIVGWLAYASLSGLLGLCVGAVIALLLHKAFKPHT